MAVRLLFRLGVTVPAARAPPGAFCLGSGSPLASGMVPSRHATRGSGLLEYYVHDSMPDPEKDGKFSSMDHSNRPPYDKRFYGPQEYAPQEFSIGKNKLYPKMSTNFPGVRPEPFWHTKVKNLCLDLLELVKKFPEGWPDIIPAECYATEMLEVLEEIDPSDWKEFEDQFKLGPVEIIIGNLQE
eukprot:226305_1